MNAPLHLQNSSTDISQQLAASSLFGGISGDIIAELARATTFSHLRKNQPVWQMGDTPEHLYLLVCGLIKRTALASNGNERVLELLTGGDCLGLSELIARRPYGSRAIAAASTHVLCIDADKVRQIMSSVPVVGQRISEVLASRQLLLEDDTTSRESRSSSERVLNFLLQRVPRPLPAHGETAIRLPASKHLIASLIGITPETLSRALRELTDSGVIINRPTSILLQNGPINLRCGLTNPSADPDEAQFSGYAQMRSNHSRIATRQRLPLYSVINIAGRQRMLSQRMAKYWLMLGSSQLGSLAARKGLAQSIELFDRQHRLLGEITTDGKLVEVRSRLGRLWKTYRTVLERPHAIETARSLYALNEEVLQAADDQTLLYTGMSQTQGATLVNSAGRQRMLAQRVAKLQLFADQDIRVQECLDGIQTSGAEFGTTLDHLDAIAPNKEIRAALLTVRQRWLALQEGIDDSTQLDAGDRAARISSLSEQVVRQMDGAVLLFERVAEAA